MAQRKALSKGTSENKSIESTDLDNESSSSTTLDKSVQSTNPSNIQHTNNDASENKSKSQPYERLNLLSRFIHSTFIDFM